MNKEEVYATLNRAYFAADCHERDLLEQLPRLLGEARLFVDVGASLGQYTKAASACMRHGRIVAIEADPLRHEELARNAAAWSAATGTPIEARFAAVSDVAGDVAFHTTHSNVSGGLFRHPVKTAVEWQEIAVPGVTLDGLFSETMPALIKADIEGAEMRMLRGATGILRRRETLFLLEIHPWADPAGDVGDDIVAYMRQWGYWPVSFYEHTLFLPFGWRYLREKAMAGIRKLRRR